MKPLSFIGSLLHTLLSYLLVSAAFMAIALPLTLLMFLPKRLRENNRLLYWLLHTFYVVMQKATLSPLQVKGVLPLDHPAVIVANHQSALDIPLIGSLLGRQPHTWLVLSYYTKFPVLGRFIRTMCVSVDKATPGKLAQAMMHAVKLATVSGRHMIIFPEGRRVTDGAIHCFRQGFALIARRSKRPVIPVVIKNAARVYPPDGWLIKRASLELIVGPAFVLQPAETDEQFCSRVRAWFVEHEPVC